MEWDVSSLLAAGGDTATLGILYGLWRIERRLFKVEIDLDTYLQKGKPE